MTDEFKPPDRYESGAYRFNAEDKLRYDLVPAKAFQELVRVYTVGAKKYSDDNWRKGFPYKRMVGAIGRHMGAWLLGEIIDPDTGCHHMACAAWNALGLVEYYYTKKGTNDLWKYEEGTNEGT